MATAPRVPRVFTMTEMEQLKARCLELEAENRRIITSLPVVQVNARSPYECYWSRRALIAEAALKEALKEKP